jgi:hypothetical protein
MSGFGFWPVAVQPVGNVSSGTLLWRVSGKLHVTVVVKATFELDVDGVARPTAPEPVDPRRGELAPYLGLTDVVVTAAHAHSCPPAPVTAIAVRVAVIRDWPLLDKRLLVYGDDPRRGSLFTQAAVVVDGAVASPPGVLLNPREPNQPVGYGQLADDDPGRSSLLVGRPPPEATAGVMEIREGFDWSYFQVAPKDQRIAHLRGDEWLVLDGFHPNHPRIKCRLPSAHADVRVYPPSMQVADGATFHVAMLADRLNIDADRLRCSLLWRGSFPVADEASARALTLLAALTTPQGPPAILQAGSPIDQPLSRPEPAVGSPPQAVQDPAVDSNAETRRLKLPKGAGAALPSEQEPSSEPAPSVDTGVTTLVREEGLGLAGSDRVDVPEHPPPTVRMGTSPPSPDQLRAPPHTAGAPLPPLRAKPTIPYDFNDEERSAPSETGTETLPNQPSERPSAAPAPSAPAESGVAVREASSVLARIAAQLGDDEDGAATHVREPVAELRSGSTRPSKPPILPSRAELPMYLPSEAKRWAREAPRSGPAAESDREEGAAPESHLELDSQGALSVRYGLGAEAESPEDDDPPTAVAPSLLTGGVRRAGQAPSQPLPLRRGDGLGPPSSDAGAAWAATKQFAAPGHVLRPQPIPGAPWSARPSPTSAGAPASAASMSPSDLPLVSVDDLQGTASEVLSARDVDVEIFDEETSVSEGSVAPSGGAGIIDEETSVSEGSRPRSQDDESSGSS